VTACNKRAPGSGCAAWYGENRMHAIFGGSERCIATHPSDMCVALVALDAVVEIRGGAEPRTVPVADFHLPAGEKPHVESVLAPGELVTHIVVPATAFAARSTYLKIRDRASYAFALVSAAVALEVAGGKIREARVALGGVGTKPWRSKEAEEALRGQRAEPRVFMAAAEAAMKGAQPRPHNRFKIGLARVTLARALASVGGRS
jgi:xanthine dehydrogenase YagS FAD-binding subunit